MIFDQAPQGSPGSCRFQHGSFGASREGTRRFHRVSRGFHAVLSVGSHRVPTGFFQVQEDL